MVKCTKCGGEIDKNTLVCTVCQHKYSQEDYDRLAHLEKLSRSWIFGVSHKKTNELSYKDVLQHWLLGEDQTLQKLILELESGVRELTNAEIRDIDIAIALKLKELETKQIEIEKKYKEVTQLQQKLETLLTAFTKENPNIREVFEQNVALIKENNALIFELNQLKSKIAHYENVLSSIITTITGKEYDARTMNIYSIKNMINDLYHQKEELMLELELKENENALLREKFNEVINSVPMQEQELKRKELELNHLQIKLENFQKQLQLREKRLEEREVSRAVETKLPEEVVEELKQKNAEIEQYKAELKLKDELLHAANQADNVTYLSEKMSEELKKYQLEIEELKQALNVKDTMLEQLREKLKFKEEEINRREEDLNYREAKLQEQLRRYELDKIELENLQELKKQYHLEDLNEIIKKKENELNMRIKFLENKEKELELKEKGLIDKELDFAKEEIAMEIKQKKIKTGIRRLDDLLYGGYPIGSNIIVYGPAYSGKEVLIYSFIAGGLKKGVPVIVLLLDKTLNEIMEDMKFVLPNIKDYTDRDLLHIIDAYSRSIGDTTVVKKVTYIDSQTNIEKIMNTVDKIVKSISTQNTYYRLAVFSLSTMLTFLDKQKLLRFLQPFTTKRKKDRAVSLYLMEKGIHSESEVQMISYLMSGTIEFKNENLKTYLRIKGITDVQSRAWIEITPSKRGIIMGSFTLGHIR